MPSSFPATILTLARTLNAKNGPKDGRRLPPLVFLTDQPRQGDTAALLAQLPPGTLVILRDYAHPRRAEHLATLAQCCRAHRLPFLVAGDPALARRLGAAGVHFPERSWRQLSYWRRRHPAWLITGSAHSATTLRRLEAAGADAAFLSPLFSTATHPGARPLGTRGFVRLARHTRLPLYALGGIGPATASATRLLPACGLAVLGAYLGAAKSPETRAKPHKTREKPEA